MVAAELDRTRTSSPSPHPLALDVALTVQGEIEARADEADALRQSHVQRARHRADLARRTAAAC